MIAVPDLKRRELVVSFSALFLGWAGGAKAAGRKFRDIKELRDYVMAVLVKEKGVSNVRRHPRFEEKIIYTLNDIKIESNITNLFTYINGYPDENPDAVIAKWLQSAKESADSGKAIFLPVIRTSSYTAEISRLNSDILSDRFLSGLQIIYMVDRPNSISPVSLGEFPGKAAGDIRKEAYNTIRQGLSKLVSDDISGLGMLYYVEGNTMLSPSLILLDEFWGSIKSRFPNNALIAIPRRDQLFIFDDTAEGRSVARKMIKVTIAEGYGVLSDGLYARRGGKIVALGM
jgi:uncharacterized protein YtpQ (UPF0354 family)